MLKTKEEIKNYKKKAEILKRFGWETWYSDDNWIKTKWWTDPNVDINTAGLTTEQVCKRIGIDDIDDED